MGSFAPTRNPAGQSLGADDIQLQREDAGKIDIVGLFTDAFETIKERPAETVGGGVALMAASFFVNIVLTIITSIIIGILAAVVGSSEAGSYAVIGLQVVFQLFSVAVLVLVQGVLGGGYNILWLRLIRGEEVSFNNFMDVKPFIIPLVLTTLLMQLAMGVGYVLLIIPGIIIALGIWAAPIVVVDKNLTNVEALKASWRIMDGHKIEMLLVGLAAGVVNFVGMLACGVGLLVSVPMTVGALAGFYNKLAAPGRAYAESDALVSAFE